MNKSEELAKLLGIEPECQWVIMYRHCDMIGNRAKILTSEKDKISFENNFNKNPSVYKEIISTKLIKYNYPDFTKPSNYIELLEMPIDNNTDRYSTLGELILYLNGDLSSRNRFINELIALFDISNQNYNKIICDIIRQQAQKTDWSY